MAKVLPVGNDADDFLTEAETAAELRVHVSALARLRYHRAGPAYTRIAGRIVYPRRALRHWRNEQTRPPRPAHFSGCIVPQYSFLDV